MAKPMTRDEIVSIIGPADNALMAELNATGASAEELREAWMWLNGEEALMNSGRPLPGSNVATLMEILEPDDEEF